MQSPKPFKKRSLKRPRVNDKENENSAAISDYMKVASEHLAKQKSSASPNLPIEIQGFLMTLGEDLSAITDDYTRRMAMVEIQNIALQKRFHSSNIPSYSSISTHQLMPKESKFNANVPSTSDGRGYFQQLMSNTSSNVYDCSAASNTTNSFPYFTGQQ